MVLIQQWFYFIFKFKFKFNLLESICIRAFIYFLQVEQSKDLTLLFVFSFVRLRSYIKIINVSIWMKSCAEVACLSQIKIPYWNTHEILLVWMLTVPVIVGEVSLNLEHLQSTVYIHIKHNNGIDTCRHACYWQNWLYS